MSIKQQSLFADASRTPTREEAIAQRDQAMAVAEENAGADFMERAKAFVLRYLAAHGPTSGEDVTEACVAATARLAPTSGRWPSESNLTGGGPGAVGTQGADRDEYPRQSAARVDQEDEGELRLSD